jgi:hypothetical protein
VAALFNSPVLAVFLAQVLTTLVAAVSLWWRKRQRQRDMALSHHLILEQISAEIGVIAAWINAYRLVAPHEAHSEEYSRARCDLERAYGRLAETRELRLGAEPSASQTAVPTGPADLRDRPAPAPAPQPSSPPKATVKPHWIMAVAAVVFLWPAGIWAIICATRVASGLKSGDEAVARRYSSQVKIWFWISAGFFVGLLVLEIIIAYTHHGTG